MKKLLTSHFRNEEYLLPWWLNHHKKYFDHGVLFDYKSTDNSVNIIKEICPTWEVIPSENKFFSPFTQNIEIERVEAKYPDWWKICLTTTEFLLGKWSTLNDKETPVKIFVPEFIMVDNKEQEGLFPDQNIDLPSQRTHGIHFKDKIVHSPEVEYTKKEFADFVRLHTTGLSVRHHRLLHKFTRPYKYPCGRHFPERGVWNNQIPNTTDDFVILYYRFSPLNELALKRINAVKDNIPQSEIPGPNRKYAWIGINHFFTEKDTKTWMKEWQANSRDLSKEIQHYLNLSK